MRIQSRATRFATAAVALTAAFCGGHALAQKRGGAPIVGTFGVGGVISEDGALWQYDPDEKRWMTIDERFKRDNHETHILPLPVEAKDIRSMESWGFLVTKSGKIWFYDLDTNKWVDIGTP